ncbi:flagellar biosynthetic protein FliO [Ancylobacter sp. MQZ15Z-1]|uniref:Flagellar biosynthetic protein FliO n=1 Tax=Ancylobacter mangrovi TaxID=2972472 RepID=A0A9X2PCJ0_9HYPH|nr:flagellar biosynthetic protein FliO [Ancylobacter mangrovi]MCS0496136.1 flagellar biosynthetic protein FliO [Ancylobacter mangrovi]
MTEMLSALTGAGNAGLLLALAGAVVLALIVILFGRRARRRNRHAMVGGHRLAVVDQLQIDETRRLVLIQRDDVQHLVVLGGGSDFLVESGIGATPVVTQAEPHPPAREPATPPSVPPAARPPAPPPERPLASTRPAASPAFPQTRPTERTESGPRVTVKVDPAFAGMVEQLEETLRRPAVSAEPVAPRPEPVSRAEPAPRVPRPAPAPQRIPTEHRTEPGISPIPADVGREPSRPAARAPEILSPLTSAGSTAASDAPPSSPVPVNPAPARPAPLGPSSAGHGSTGPAPTSEASAPEVISPEPASPGSGRSPEVIPPSASERVPDRESGEAFDIEMANLLGRTRRP